MPPGRNSDCGAETVQGVILYLRIRLLLLMTSTPFAESVIRKVEDWLRTYGYPTTIPGKAGKEFSVRYRGRT